MKAKRGRPKGRSSDKRSFGPLGDLIRQHRLSLGLGLADVAKACRCSVQFISNIEHGRAPLPWEKTTALASCLNIPLEELQAANLAVRSDFKGFVGTAGGNKRTRKSAVEGTATTVALTTQDAQLREVVKWYQVATPAAKKKFFASASKILSEGPSASS